MKILSEQIYGRGWRNGFYILVKNEQLAEALLCNFCRTGSVRVGVLTGVDKVDIRECQHLSTRTIALDHLTLDVRRSTLDKMWLKVLELPMGMTKFADVYAGVCVRA